MNAKKIITILGITIVFVGIGIGAYFVFQKGLISFSSDPSIVPSKVKITNINNDRFTVSWTTSDKTNGSLAYGTSSKLDQIQLDDADQLTGQSKVRSIHHVTITNLKPATNYYFKIRSGEKNKLFDDNGSAYTVKTAPVLGSQPPTDLMNGVVLDENNKPAEGAVVFVTIPGVSPLSTQVKKDGSWLITLSNARNTQLTDYASYDLKTSIIEISVHGENKVSKITTNTANKSPVPQIVLGQTYDFTSNEIGNVGIGKDEDENNELLNEEVSEDSISDEASDSGRPLESFPLTENYVEITYPNTEAQVLDVTKPVFKGFGPEEKVLNISIVEEELFRGSTTVDTTGEWEFKFNNSLEPGEDYTLRVDYYNEDDEIENIERSFSISEEATAVTNSSSSSSAGGNNLPEYSDSTPSATVRPTARPTTVATVRPSSTPRTTASPSASSSANTKGGIRSSMPSTSSGTPVSGTSIPTIFMFLLGGGLIISGYSLRKKGL